MTKLERTIKALQRSIKNHIDGINQGGCIHFAYYFSKKLKELNIDHKVVFTDYNTISLTYKNFIPVEHVMIYISGIGYIDGYDIHKKFELNLLSNYTIHTNPSLKKLDRFRNDYQWNCWYDQYQNDLLEELINNRKYASRRNIHKKG